MNDVVTVFLAIYMLVGMFVLVGTGALPEFTGGWIMLLGQGWLPVTRFILYVLAVFQVLALWVFWPFVLMIRNHREAQRIERRRIP